MLFNAAGNAASGFNITSKVPRCPVCLNPVATRNVESNAKPQEGAVQMQSEVRSGSSLASAALSLFRFQWTLVSCVSLSSKCAHCARSQWLTGFFRRQCPHTVPITAGDGCLQRTYMAVYSSTDLRIMPSQLPFP
jgi:hypothetical protein